MPDVVIDSRCTIDLQSHERERTVERWYQLEEDAGSVLLLITVSGTSASAESVGNLNDYHCNREQLIQKYVGCMLYCHFYLDLRTSSELSAASATLVTCR